MLRDHKSAVEDGVSSLLLSECDDIAMHHA